MIGIANTASDLNPCNLKLHSLARACRAGVERAGGIAVEFPVMSLGEDLMKPTAMLYRNLLAMEVEETICANPLDAVILLANCDKTVPAMVMGALSTDLPFLVVTGGSRPPACLGGERIGTGTDLWRYWDRRRNGELSDAEWRQFEAAISQGLGACNTMGTASTMAILTETVGLSMPGSATLPSNSRRIVELAEAAGARSVTLARTGLRPSHLLSLASFHNAIKVLSATGGSTNAVIHLTAMARRAGISISLDDFSALGASVPVVVDVEPTGGGLIGDFAAAGGVPTLCKAIAEHLDLTPTTVSGLTIGQIAASAQGPSGVITSLDHPVCHEGAIRVVKGNLAPDGAIMRISTSDPKLLRHQGPAVVFDDYQQMLAEIDDPARGIGKDSVLILRGCGPVGGPGMPEWGMIPIPSYLRSQGVSDMVRITDGRMSGTSFGSIALHVSPEAAVGGPLALVADGDSIRLDASANLLQLLVSESELAARRSCWQPPLFREARGWPALYRKHVRQASEGCDFDFLETGLDRTPALLEPIVGRS